MTSVSRHSVNHEPFFSVVGLKYARSIINLAVRVTIHRWELFLLWFDDRRTDLAMF